MIEAAGFSQVKHRNLTGGIAAIHSGWGHLSMAPKSGRRFSDKAMLKERL